MGVRLVDSKLRLPTVVGDVFSAHDLSGWGLSRISRLHGSSIHPEHRSIREYRMFDTQLYVGGAVHSTHARPRVSSVVRHNASPVLDDRRIDGVIIKSGSRPRLPRSHVRRVVYETVDGRGYVCSSHSVYHHNYI